MNQTRLMGKLYFKAVFKFILGHLFRMRYKYISLYESVIAMPQSLDIGNPIMSLVFQRQRCA